MHARVYREFERIVSARVNISVSSRQRQLLSKFITLPGIITDSARKHSGRFSSTEWMPSRCVPSCYRQESSARE